MANKTLSDFLPDIMPLVAGAPEPLVENAVRNALIQFCEETEVYQDWTSYTVTANDNELEFDPPKDTIVIRPKEIKLDGELLDPRIPHDLDREREGWETETGTPLFYFMKTPRLLQLVPIPDASQLDLLQIWAVLKPTKTATNIVDWIYEEYFEDIKQGVLARLYVMPNEPWSSALRGKSSQDAWDTCLANRKLQGQRNFTRAPLRTRAYYSIG